MMKAFAIPVLVFLVGLLGYWVYRETETQKQQNFNEVMHEADKSLRLIESNRHRD